MIVPAGSAVPPPEIKPGRFRFIVEMDFLRVKIISELRIRLSEFRIVSDKGGDVFSCVGELAHAVQSRLNRENAC